MRRGGFAKCLIKQRPPPPSHFHLKLRRARWNIVVIQNDHFFFLPSASLTPSSTPPLAQRRRSYFAHAHTIHICIIIRIGITILYIIAYHTTAVVAEGFSYRELYGAWLRFSYDSPPRPPFLPPYTLYTLTRHTSPSEYILLLL